YETNGENQKLKHDKRHGSFREFWDIARFRPAWANHWGIRGSSCSDRLQQGRVDQFAFIKDKRLEYRLWISLGNFEKGITHHALITRVIEIVELVHQLLLLGRMIVG